jgi:hypothetical protein
LQASVIQGGSRSADIIQTGGVSVHVSMYWTKCAEEVSFFVIQVGNLSPIKIDSVAIPNMFEFEYFSLKFSNIRHDYDP